MRKVSILPLLIALLFSRTPIHCEDATASIRGDWVIDADESMALFKTSPKYKESDEAMVAKVLQKRQAVMSLNITDEACAITLGGKPHVIPFTVKSSSAGEVVTTAKAGDREFELTFKLIKGQFLQMISSASDDMNYFAWKRKVKVLGHATVVAESAPIYRGKEQIATAKKDEKLEVTQVRGDWYGVIPAGGWLHKKYVDYTAKSDEGASGIRPAAETLLAAFKAANAGDYDEADRLVHVGYVRMTPTSEAFWDFWTYKKTLTDVSVAKEEKTGDVVFVSILRINDAGKKRRGPHWKLKWNGEKWQVFPEDMTAERIDKAISAKRSEAE